MLRRNWFGQRERERHSMLPHAHTARVDVPGTFAAVAPDCGQNASEWHGVCAKVSGERTTLAIINSVSRRQDVFFCGERGTPGVALPWGKTFCVRNLCASAARMDRNATLRALRHAQVTGRLPSRYKARYEHWRSKRRLLDYIYKWARFRKLAGDIENSVFRERRLTLEEYFRCALCRETDFTKDGIELVGGHYSSWFLTRAKFVCNDCFGNSADTGAIYCTAMRKATLAFELQFAVKRQR